VIPLRQFLPTIHARQISSEFFIFQQDSAPVHMALEAINFSPITLPNVELFQQVLGSSWDGQPFGHNSMVK